MKTYSVVGYDVEDADTWLIVLEAEDPKDAVQKAVDKIRLAPNVDMDDVDVSWIFDGPPCLVSNEDIKDAFK